MMEYWKEKKKETDCSPMPPGGTKETTRLKYFKCYVKDTECTFLCKVSVFPCNTCDVFKVGKVSLHKA